MDSFSYTEKGQLVKKEMVSAADAAAGTDTTGKVVVYDSEDEWYQAKPSGEKTVGDNDVIFIKNTGEFVFGKEMAHALSRDKAQLSVSYTKTGFDAGEARPEYYYDCTMKTPDMDEAVTYTKENQQIEFTISSGITFPANTQASEVFDTSIGRDVNEMIDIVTTAIKANNKGNDDTGTVCRQRQSGNIAGISGFCTERS